MKRVFVILGISGSAFLMSNCAPTRTQQIWREQQAAQGQLGLGSGYNQAYLGSSQVGQRGGGAPGDSVGAQQNASYPSQQQYPQQGAGVSDGGSVRPSGVSGGGNTAPVSNGRGGEHVIQTGDTLWNIGSRYGVTVEQLKAANGLPTDIIVLGNTLRIP